MENFGKNLFLALILVVFVAFYSFSFTSAETYLCYQESANVSNQGLAFGNPDGNCSLNYSGSYSSSNATTYLYINYTKPLGALNSSKWKVAVAKSSKSLNFSIPNDCWTFGADNLIFRIESDSNTLQNKSLSNLSCLGGADNWMQIYQISTPGEKGVFDSCNGGNGMYDGNWTSYGGSLAVMSNRCWASNAKYGQNGYKVYEEAMVWNVSSVICTPNMIYTDWTPYVFDSCLGNQTNQTSNRTHYDSNSCGDIENMTEFRYQLLEPNWVNSTDWGAWTDFGLARPNNTILQESNRTLSNSLGCGLDYSEFQTREAPYDFDGEPRLNITYPVNSGIYSANITTLNYTINDSAPLFCWTSVNSSKINLAGENFTGLVSGDGNHTWTIFCNDSYGNVANASITFLVNSSIRFANESVWSDNGFFYMNYSKPANYSNVTWQVKHGLLPEYNISIPSDCLNADIFKLMLRFYSNTNDGAGNAISQPYCYNGTVWKEIGNTSTSNFTIMYEPMYCRDIPRNSGNHSFDGNWTSFAERAVVDCEMDNGSSIEVGGIFNDNELPGYYFDMGQGARIYEEEIFWSVPQSCASGQSLCSDGVCRDSCGSPPSGNTGGGGGGGSCYYNWTCSSWSGCVNGAQTRTCTQNNSRCYSSYLVQPSVNQTCVIPIPVISNVTNQTNAGNESITNKTGFFSFITGGVTGISEDFNKFYNSTKEKVIDWYNRNYNRFLNMDRADVALALAITAIIISISAFIWVFYLRNKFLANKNSRGNSKKKKGKKEVEEL